MPKQLPFTSTLPPELLQWLEEMAARQKTTKKHIILTALNLLKKEERRKELISSFQRAAQDQDILAMAEDGLDDSLAQLEHINQ